MYAPRMGVRAVAGLAWVISLGVTAVAVVGLAGGPVRAQEAGPEMAPLPYANYLTELEELQAAGDAVFERLGATPTASEVIAAYRESVALGEADQRRLHEIVPEPCYAAAHAEVLAYRASIIELAGDALPRLTEAATWTDFFTIIEDVDAELYARHPSAYVERPEESRGFGGSHRNILAELATCTTGASTPLADPEPERSQGPPSQQVVVEGAYLVIIPGDWRYELEKPFDDRSEQDRARRSLGFAPDLHLWADAGGEACRVEYGPNDGETLQSLLAEGRQHPEFELGYVDLPAGRAVRIAGPVDQAGLESELVGYVLIPGSTRVQVWCNGSVSPDDGWLSIAETLEFLPTEERASPSGEPGERSTDGDDASADSPPGGRFGPDVGLGRIERPPEGFAITFPSDWTVEEVSAVGNEWIDEHAENPQGAAVITQLVWAGDEWLNEQCFVSDASAYAASPPAWISLEQGVEHEAAAMARWPRVEEHESSYLDLPAGRTGLVEVRYEDGSVGQMYIFRHDERWFTLHCEAYVQPMDDWLAIAETFEFLPPGPG